MNILFDDRNRNPVMEPLSRFSAFFEWKLAGLTAFERLHLETPKAKFYYVGDSESFAHLLYQRHPNLYPYRKETIDQTISVNDTLPWEMLGAIPKYIETVLSLRKDWKKFRQKYKVKTGKFELVGKDKHLYLHPEAQVYPGVVFDTTRGPILIDAGSKITPFSFLEGPLYVGKQSQIDNVRITGGCLIGDQCRVGGEIENSILADYTNKHHEGFLGHSIVSSWVNLGALSTTSDLKNNYGVIKLKIRNQVVNTGTIKFGSIIGPFTKVGIGAMINTGTVLDIGNNLVDSKISDYVRPFTWINQNKGFYRLSEFLQDTKKIMARRGIELLKFEEEYLSILYEECQKES